MTFTWMTCQSIMPCRTGSRIIKENMNLLKRSNQSPNLSPIELVLWDDIKLVIHKMIPSIVWMEICFICRQDSWLSLNFVIFSCLQGNVAQVMKISIVAGIESCLTSNSQVGCWHLLYIIISHAALMRTNYSECALSVLERASTISLLL